METPTLASTNNDTLGTIRELVASLEALAQEIESDEERLMDKKKRFNLIKNETLPELFLEADITELTSSSGKKLTLRTFFVGNAKSDKALTWLEENGFGSLINNTVTAKFKKGENEEAQELEEWLKTRGFGFTAKEAIHHATLNSFINEQITADPDNFPRELFNAHEVKEIKIK